MTALEQHEREFPLTVPDASNRKAQMPVTIVQAEQRWVPINFPELWAYRELLYFLVWRDVKVRYRQTALGGAWAVIQPLLTMVVFSIVFGRLAGIPSEGIPYPVFAYAALVPWSYFANSVTQASASLVVQERLLTRVYFPRVQLPVATVLAALVDFAFAFTVLIGLQLYYGIVPSLAIVTLPIFVMLAIATALGVGLWLSAINIQYRDVRYITPFLLQFWLFATPVAYSSSLVPEQWRPLFGLNPMAGVVEGFRWALLGQGNPPGGLFMVSILVATVLVITGLYYFRRMEQNFADLV
jgi:lipopolysaccharide transport system permease protein